jgi:nucleoside-diphosphate-sugar epimerase
MNSLLLAGHQVLRTSQSKEIEEGFIPISPWKPFQGQHLSDVDFIINAANSYWPNPNKAQIQEMEDSILGISETIKASIPFTNAKIITFSTYFQYAPVELMPWSEYSSLKNHALQEIENVCGQHGNHLMNIVLRDNYGGSRKDKFLDMAISANKSQTILQASPGDSILNLVHVKDIAEAIVRYLSSQSQHKEFLKNTYEISSENSYTLRELISFIDTHTKVPTIVNWGSHPYREKEVFKEWGCAELFPYFKETRELGDYVNSSLHQA